jgi:hypothetical protein
MQAPLSSSKPEQVSIKGTSYADIMASGGLETVKVPSVDIPETTDKATPPVSEICLKMSSMDLSTPSSKISSSGPSPIESIHAPQKTRAQEPNSTIVMKTDEKSVVVGKTVGTVPEPQKSVLFAPAEVKVNKKYGGWSGLKGDPEKLERLNQPRVKPLESRWAC